MILEHIVLENVRSHKRTEIIFKRGTTLLSGSVGSGKSSILMAIEFALFGLGPQKAEALIAKRANSATVELRFSVGDAKYEIRRVLKKTENRVSPDSKGTYLVINGEKQTYSVAEIKQQMMQILHFNEPFKGGAISRIFRYAVFTPQEEMKAVLADHRDRLSTIRRAFGIEEYKTAADNAKMVAVEIAKRASKYAGMAEGAEDIEAEIEVCKKRLQDLHGQLGEARADAEKSSREIGALSADREEMATQESEKAELDQKMAGAEATVAEKTQRLESLAGEIAKDEAEAAAATEQIAAHRVPEKPTEMSAEQIDAEVQRMARAEKELADVRARSKATSDEISEIESEMGGRASADSASLRSEEVEAREQAEATRKLQKDAEQRALEAEYEVRRHSDEIAQIEKVSAEALREGTKCPMCENIITGDHLRHLQKERQEKRALLESNMARAEQDKSLATGEAKEARAKAESCESEAETARKLSELASKRAAKSAEIEEAAARMSELGREGPADEMRELRARLTEYMAALNAKDMLAQRLDTAQNNAQRHRAEMSSVESGLADAQKERAEATVGLEKFAGLDERVARLDAKIAEKREQESQNRVRQATCERDVANDEAALEDNESRLSKAKDAAKERDRHSDYETWLTKFFIAAMPAIEKRVMREAWADFNEAYRGWYARLVDDYTKESSIDEEFAPHVRQDGWDQDVSYMSGGERTGVALAYRLALNSVLRKKTNVLKSSLLILDEPTDGFSNDQMVKIKNILDELDSEQIIMVSHDRNLEGFADHVVRVRRDGDYSRVD